MQSLRFFVFLSGLLLLWECRNQQSQNQSTLKQLKIDSVGKSIDQQDTGKDETIFDTLTKKELFKRLFDNPIIDTINEEALWAPNYYERVNFTVSYDKKCHTGIDTIMYFTDKDSDKNAVVIFGTYNYDNRRHRYGTHSVGAPIGIALFSQTDKGKWQLYTFEKIFTRLGLYGGADKTLLGRGAFSLVKIGDKWTCLSLEQENCANGGYLSHTRWLYSIERLMLDSTQNENILSNILIYNPADCNAGSLDSIKYDLKTELKLIKKRKSYYDIDLITKGKGETGTKHFKFSEDSNLYVEKKYKMAPIQVL